MARIDRELASRKFTAGDRFSVADITGLVALDFARTARIAIPEALSDCGGGARPGRAAQRPGLGAGRVAWARIF